ncbi:hypothetical protein G5S52_12660 [Grimontia sp. S25]|uniref:Capsule polysaccharide biosynthesis protein n=1 Tax=Grimontia sedimenti TaxID=2711294 RepID=A0A6M1RKW9_9GAMM|nr:hypothetical protein [Grimontia sedimenti]NGN98468.1 hypothetical protein [Grimontia sedimenti]
MNVLVYTRPRIDKFFHALAESIACFDNVIYASDHKGLESLWIMEYYYKAYEDMVTLGTLPESDIDTDAVAARCRYLKTLPKDEAQKKIDAMTIAAERIIDEYKIDYMFGMVMDSYLMDIFDRVLRKRGRQYIGFLNNMVNGYSRLTCRGELIQLDSVEQEQVKGVRKELVSKHYMPNMQRDFMWNTSPFSMFFTKYIKEKLKTTYYHFAKLKDKDNFYYNTVSAKHCMSCHDLDQLFFRRFQNNDWLTSVDEARKQGKVILYFPLQFYPECSIDYWGTNRDFIDFYRVVEKIIDNDYSNVIILAKEHPSATGLRKSDFYKLFAKNKHVILTPFDVASNDVIEASDIVLTWTGSVGFEAIMRGKPLISFGEAYYDPGFGIQKLEHFDELANLESIVLETMSNRSTSGSDDYKDSVVKFMLEGLVKGYIFPLDYLTKKNPENSDELKMLGENISNNILKIAELGNYAIKDGCFK